MKCAALANLGGAGTEDIDMTYNFDELIDRSGTNSVKMDCLPEGSPADSLPLWVADMDFACAEPIISAITKRVGRRIFGYTTYDNKRMMDAVTGWYRRRFGWEVDEGDIFYAPGVVPAFSALINCLTEEGDGVIIQKPVYHPFSLKIEANNRQIANNALILKDGNYHIDYADLEAKLAVPENKGVLFCSPHNPVGRVWTEDELRQVVALCKRYNKWIISDEIHFDLTRTGVTHHPLLKIAPEYREQIIVCTAPSKTFNLAGAQLSNIVIPNQEYQRRWVAFMAGRLGMDECSPFALAAVTAAYNECEDWVDQLRVYLDDNIASVKAFIGEHFPKAFVADCQGTYLMWVDFSAYYPDELELEAWFRQKARVALNQGYMFGEEGKGFVRINTASPRSVLTECLNRMLAAWEK